MNRSSQYFDLRYVVQCKRPPNPATWWENIAAFNSDRVAVRYADDCRKAHEATWNYRVMQRKGNKWVEITTPEF